MAGIEDEIKEFTVEIPCVYRDELTMDQQDNVGDHRTASVTGSLSVFVEGFIGDSPAWLDYEESQEFEGTSAEITDRLDDLEKQDPESRIGEMFQRPLGQNSDEVNSARKEIKEAVGIRSSQMARRGMAGGVGVGIGLTALATDFIDGSIGASGWAGLCVAGVGSIGGALAAGNAGFKLNDEVRDGIKKYTEAVRRDTTLRVVFGAISKRADAKQAALTEETKAQ